MDNRKPIAVLISDTHYSLSTYQIADKAWRMAVDKAAELGVPLVDAGDLTNDKAILRAEVVNTLIETMEYAAFQGVDVFCLVGNHSLINEKGEEHALHFLEPYCDVVDRVCTQDIGGTQLGFIPYQTKTEDFLEALNVFEPGIIVIGHQGTKGGVMGDYIQDHSAFDSDLAKSYKVFLGHYHSHYTQGTTVSIGNPYTLTFGEAKDPAKGFLVLYSDGSFERVLTSLRKHVITEICYSEDASWAATLDYVASDDLLWVKMSGPRSKLDSLDKQELAKRLGRTDFKLDKIYTESAEPKPTAKPLTPSEAFDFMIELTTESAGQKTYLKTLYRELLK